MPVSNAPRVTVIGGGPAGLMAAEVLISGGAEVDVYDAMPSVGRKFLMAGKGGLNITHAGPVRDFLTLYGPYLADLQPALEAFDANALREWMRGLGIESYVGTSGRVFPCDRKAAPLLRAWLNRLRQTGCRFHLRHRWLGWNASGQLRFASPDGEIALPASPMVLALGGGSWPQLGSDAAWVPLLAGHGLSIAPLRPANCGFNIGWSDFFSGRYAGYPVKTIELRITPRNGPPQKRRGEFVITRNGVEGSLIYALSAILRDEIEAAGQATVFLDLLPDWPADAVAAELSRPRGSRSLSSHLQSRLGLKGVKRGLLREVLPPAMFSDLSALAAAIKSLPLHLESPRPLAEAISSAGGVRFCELDPHLMLRRYPGIFCAGEMLDWEAPTGGYLLTACLATGRAAGRGMLHWLQRV